MTAEPSGRDAGGEPRTTRFPDVAARRNTPFAPLAALVWLVVTVSAFALLGEMIEHFDAEYAGLELELPGYTTALIALGPGLRHPACAVIVVVAGIAPILAGARGMRAARRYAAATVAVIVATAIAIQALDRPLRVFEESVAPAGSRSG